MSESRMLPVRKWAPLIAGGGSTDDELRDAWRWLVKSHGWSQVGDEIDVLPDGRVVGRVVEFPGVTVEPGAQYILVPPSPPPPNARKPPPPGEG